MKTGKYRKSVLGVLLVWILMITSCANASGLSEESRAHIQNSLKSYEPARAKGKLTESDRKAKDTYCERENYSRDKYCLEKKYMVDDYYLVRIGYNRDAKIPEQPSASHIVGSNPFRRDIAKQEAFLKEWSDPVFREYIGNDYHRFSSVELIMVNRIVVVITLQVRSADELNELMTDDRIVYVTHIGNPEVELEELVD